MYRTRKNMVSIEWMRNERFSISGTGESLEMRQDRKREN